MKIKDVTMGTLACAVIVGAVIVGVSTPRPSGVLVHPAPTSGLTSSSRIPAAAVAPVRATEAIVSLPLRFEPNHGQTDSSVKFLSRGPGYGMFLTQTEVVMVLSKRQTEPDRKPQSNVVRMQLRGANKDAEVVGVDALTGKTNYLVGDRSNWRSDIPTYAKVQYRGIYRGIDSIYYGNGRRLEYDFVVSPGADPQDIRLGFDGSDHLSVDSNGSLLVQAGAQHVQMLKPVVYQQVRGERHEISGEFVLLDQRNVAFHVGEYDRNQPLIIDPTILYATYLGGNANDAASGIAVDGAGDIYVTGSTSSTDFPNASSYQSTNQGLQDAYVTKINAAGTAYIYSTYIGGADADVGTKIAVDSSGNAYITGYTFSLNFPLLNAATGHTALGPPSDAFITELNASGNALVFSEYLGGSAVMGLGGGEVGSGIVVDGSGNVYVSGYTNSVDFPTLAPGPYTTAPGVACTTTGSGTTCVRDAFVVKLSGSTPGAFLFSTYLGGTNDDVANAIAIDGSTPPNIYLVGTTSSTDFPMNHPVFTQGIYNGGAHDAFVTKIAGDFTGLTYSTYLGGGADEFALVAGLGFAIAVDSSNSAYVTGATNSPGFPVFRAYQASLNPAFCIFTACTDAFVTKLNFSGTFLTIAYSTFLGGSSADAGFGIAVDGSGTAYIVGTTSSSDYPVANPTQGFYGGGMCTIDPNLPQIACPDAFISKLTFSGTALSLPFSTYIGGSVEDWGYGIALSSGNIYASGYTGGGFPVVNAKQSTFAGGTYDGFITKIQDVLPKKLRGQVISQ